jgi:siroheme synthase
VSGPGRVFIVGAGPGAPDLVTVRGLRRLRAADVVLYDRLVEPLLVAEAPEAAEKIFVGKAPGRPGIGQQGIHALMIDRARAGLRVVRLKGGDPFVFGRGAEEAAALREAGIAFEIVPGLSSALAVPAHAGIPLTQRGVARSVLVTAGHRARAHSVLAGEGDGADHERAATAAGAAPRPDAVPDTPSGAMSCSGASAAETIVVLMGVARVAEIAADLVRAGRAPDTPVAIIERGTTPQERVIYGTLHDIAARAAATGLDAPAVIVVGAVAKAHPFRPGEKPSPTLQRAEVCR